MKSYINQLRRQVLAFFTIAVLSISLIPFQEGPASADDEMEAVQLVEKADLAFQGFICDEDMGALRELIRDAKGVMIIPSLPEGAAVAGASGANGVLVTRDSLDGDWRGPAFYTIGSAGFGLETGGRSPEVILLAMTDRGVASFLGNSVKLGGDVRVAIGPVGTGASAATANLSADILSFSRANGLHGGISLDGAVVAVRDNFNRAYFKGNPSLTPADILVSQDFRIPQSSLAGSVAGTANTWETTSQCKGFARPVKPDSMALRVIWGRS